MILLGAPLRCLPSDLNAPKGGCLQPLTHLGPCPPYKSVTTILRQYTTVYSCVIPHLEHFAGAKCTTWRSLAYCTTMRDNCK